MPEPTNPGKPEIAYTADVTQSVSINTFVPVMIDGEFFKIQVTTRHGTNAEKIAADFLQHIEALRKIRAAIPLPRAAESAPVAPSDFDDQFPPIPQESYSQEPAQSAKQQHDNSFLAGRLIVEISDGKAGYKIGGKDGAKFPKFPVRVWPEILTALGINLSAINPLDPNTIPDFTGWIAEYEPNEKGFPRKVTKLTKAQQ